MKQNSRLISELRQAGAQDSEANELAGLAVSLKQLENTRSAALPEIKFQRRSRPSLFRPALASISGIVIGMALVMFAQTTLPGSILYPVQKLSDSVAVSVDPSYRGTVMMKRAQQVKQLVADHANASLVLATLSDYKSEASVYKSSPASYVAFEYCKSSLLQAATIAPTSERQAIESTLSSLQDV